MANKQQKFIYSILALLLAGGFSYFKLKNDGFVHPAHFTGCDETLWQHIYHPSRLKVIEKCTKVTGILETAKTEADGDYHIRLKLDPQFSNLINQKNTSGQHGDLVVEPICENPVTQTDAEDACKNFKQTLVVPAPGSHIEVLGSYVLDQEHGWMEIHPITTLNIIK